MDRKRVHAACQLARKRCVHHTMPFEPGLSFERVRNDIDPVVRLPTWAMSGMAHVVIRFVHHLQALRSERFAQLARDNIGSLHVAGVMQMAAMRQCRAVSTCAARGLSSLEGGTESGA